MGSKNKIANDLLSMIPNNKFQSIVVNDINLFGLTLFKNAADGKYLNENKWISRKEFFDNKNTNPFINIIWSFSGKGISYAYDENNESYKEALHEWCFNKDNSLLINRFNLTPDETFINDPYKRKLEYKKWFKSNISSDCEDTFTRLETLERLNRINKIYNSIGDKINDVTFLSMSYLDVYIEGSTVYCDIPYRSTGSYINGDGSKIDFDYDKFYNWCHNNKNKYKIYISEYYMPEEFKCIKEINRRSTFKSATNQSTVLEKLFVPKGGLSDE